MTRPAGSPAIATLDALRAAGRATIDVKPLARLLGCDENTLYRSIHAGRLPAIRLSARRVVVALDVVDLMLGGEMPLGGGGG